MPALLPHLRRLLEEAYRRPAWHGPNLKGAVRALDHRTALWRPGPGRPCVWQVVLHTAYWKHRVRARLTGEADPFPHPGRDWPRLPQRTSARQWRADLALLDRTHRRLLAAVEALRERDLERPARAHRQTPHALLVGMAFHDTYHAGQIRAIRKLAEQAARAGRRRSARRSSAR